MLKDDKNKKLLESYSDKLTNVELGEEIGGLKDQFQQNASNNKN